MNSNMRKVPLLLSVCLFLLQAEETSTASPLKNFSLSASISNFNSKSHETLYIPAGYSDAGRQISELTWQAKDVTLLGLDVQYKLKSLDFYLSYKKNISSGDGVMDDLDWEDSLNPDTLTKWSHHENTDVYNVSILDFGAKKRFELEHIKPWISVGYKQENQTYKAYDGYGVHEGKLVSFSGLVVTFEQKYEGLYIGLGADYDYNDFIFSLSTKYSPIMDASYSDTHFRSFTETTDYDETTMYNLNLAAEYHIDIHQSIALSYEYTKYDYVRGDRTRTYDVGTEYYWSDSSALDSQNNIINISYCYKF